MHQIDRRTFLRCAAGGTALALGARASAKPSQSWTGALRPNIIFILIDDLGWIDTSCYGSTFYETPNIDRLAGQGMRFTEAYAACPVCSPTRASIMTGKYPARLHLTDWIPGFQPKNPKMLRPAFNQELPLNEVTIAEALKEGGYATGSFGKWHLGGEGFHPEQQGFDVNFAGYHKGSPPSYFYPYKIPGVESGAEGEYLTDRTTDEALHFIEQHKAGPFFVYLPHYAVHTPIQGKKDLTAKYEAKVKPGQAQDNAEYAAMIESVDQSVGRIMAKLDQLGIAEETALFFTSDNGGLAWITSNAPLREGKGTLYEGGVREPLIIRWPGRIEAGTLCDTPITSVDYFPTMLEMAGLDCAVNDIDGLSLAPLLKGETLPEGHGLQTRALYWHYPHYHRGGAIPGGSIRDGGYKLIEFYGEDRVELYNLPEDLSETRDLAREMPEKARILREKLHAWLEETDAHMPKPNPDYDPTQPIDKRLEKPVRKR